MKSKLLKLMAIVFATLLFSTQAFACGGSTKDKDAGKADRDKSSMSDRDMSKDQGSYDGSKSMDQPETNLPYGTLGP